MTEFVGGAGALVSVATTYGVVALAEVGDKSQLVCMTLASRHRSWPVLLGAIPAFALLNLIAVLFGSVAAEWVPSHVLALGVGVLFAVFGIQALRAGAEEEDVDVREPAALHSIALVTFSMIFMAEFGDKTQLAVAGLGSAATPLGVWLGATAALATTSALGVWVGGSLLQRLPVVWIHRVAGLLFLVLAAAAFWTALSGFYD